MPELNDHELLAEFARTESETAFATLVARYLNLVHSTALRFTGNSHHAEEITQAVFIILARKAGKISPSVVLSGWLYQAARLTSANLVKGEIRRHDREQEAYMQTILNGPDTMTWKQIAPLLDDAMGSLGETDRNAVVLRFFENKTAAEVALALKLTEAGAHKRTARALEKLRKFFTKRGVSSTTAIIAGTISANSVQAAPVALAKSVTAVAIVKGSIAAASTLALVKGALKIMAWIKMKTAIIASAVVLLAAGTATMAVVEIEKSLTPAVIAQIGNPSNYPWQAEGYITNASGGQGINGNFLLSAKAPPLVEILPTVAPNGGPGVSEGGTSDEVKRLQFGSTVEQMVMSAYGFAFADDRTIISAPLPPERYDYIDNLSKGATQAFKDAIHEKFGITGRIVAMETNVLLLQIKNPNAPGLRPSKPDSKNQDAQSMGPNSKEDHVTDRTFTEWVNYCERTLQIPIVDQTGLTGKYDTDLKWQWGQGESEKTAFKQAVLDQLGLALVPSRQKIDILVIEKTTQPFTAAKISPEAYPSPIPPGQVDFPKASWTFIGYASPKAALETYFWALNKLDTTNLEASMTPAARDNFIKTLQETGQTEDQFFNELAPMLKNISGYRILGTNDFDIDMQIAIDGGVNKSDRVTTMIVGTAWKVDETPLHFFNTNPPPVMPKQVDYPKATWAFAGYASPEAALQTYFWALNEQNLTNFQASITPSALQDAGEPIEQTIREAAPELKKISGYRIMGIEAIAADEIVFQIATEGGKDKSGDSDEITIKKIGAEWKVAEIP